MAKTITLTHTGKGPIDPRTNTELTGEGYTLYFNDLADNLDQSQYTRSLAPPSTLTYRTGGNNSVTLTLTDRVELSIESGSIANYLANGYVTAVYSGGAGGALTLAEGTSLYPDDPDANDQGISLLGKQEINNGKVNIFYDNSNSALRVITVAPTNMVNDADDADMYFATSDGYQVGNNTTGGGEIEFSTGRGFDSNVVDENGNSGGHFRIYTGAGGDFGGQGGSISMLAGSGHLEQGGDVEINAGDCRFDGDGGGVILRAGDGNGAGNSGGDLYFAGGEGGFGNGGDVRINAGSANLINGQNGGDIQLQAGVSGANLGGAVRLYGGGSREANGGDLRIIGGYCWSNNTEGGEVLIQGGEVFNPGTGMSGGDIILRGGQVRDQGTWRGRGGDILIESGTGRNANGEVYTSGDITLQIGDAYNGSTLGELKVPHLSEGVLSVDAQGVVGTRNYQGRATLNLANGAQGTNLTITPPVVGVLTATSSIVVSLQLDNAGQILTTVITTLPFVAEIDAPNNQFTVALDITNNAVQAEDFYISYSIAS